MLFPYKSPPVQNGLSGLLRYGPKNRFRLPGLPQFQAKPLSWISHTAKLNLHLLHPLRPMGNQHPHQHPAAIAHGTKTMDNTPVKAGFLCKLRIYMKTVGIPSETVNRIGQLSIGS